MAVTIERFDLLPAAAPTPTAADQAQTQSGGGGGASSPPSRHDLLRALRQEHDRLARVRAH